MDTQGKSGIDIKTVEDAIRLVEASKLTHIKVGLSDVDGILRGKYMRQVRLRLALGVRVRSVVLGWDADDQMYDNASYTGWHTAYPDAQVRIIPQSCRLPLEIMNGEPMLFFLAEFAGDAEDICPRGVLRRVIKRRRPGLRRVFGAGIRVLRVRGNTHSVREKNYQNLKSWTPGNFGYSILRSTVNSDFYRDLIDMTETMDMPIEGLHTETGPGVLEALAVDRPWRWRGHAVQFHQGPGPAQRPDGHVHGEVVAQRARPERPHPHVLREQESGSRRSTMNRGRTT